MLSKFPTLLSYIGHVKFWQLSELQTAVFNPLLCYRRRSFVQLSFVGCNRLLPNYPWQNNLRLKLVQVIEEADERCPNHPKVARVNISVENEIHKISFEGEYTEI